MLEGVWFQSPALLHKNDMGNSFHLTLDAIIGFCFQFKHDVTGREHKCGTGRHEQRYRYGMGRHKYGAGKYTYWMGRHKYEAGEH